MSEHRHAWTWWERPIYQTDSLGQPIPWNWYPATAQLRGGTPVTPGWTRTCQTCGATEASR